VGAEEAAVCAPAVEADAGMSAKVAARHARRQRLFQRLDHSIDHGGKRRRIVAHRSGCIGAEDLPRRQHEFERAERPFIRHLACAHQIFESNARGSLAATEPSGIDRSLHLIRDAGIVDRHLIPFDDDLDSDRQRFVAGTVIVEKSLGGVGPVGHRADQRAGGGFRLVKDDFDGPLERRHAVFVDQIGGEIAPEQATGELGRDVALSSTGWRVLFSMIRYTSSIGLPLD
jgi:hypothetical protein